MAVVRTVVTVNDESVVGVEGRTCIAIQCPTRCKEVYGEVWLPI